MTIAQRLFLPFQNGGDKSSGSCRMPPMIPSPPRILATSSSIVDRNQQRIFQLRDLDRKMCEDRKTPFEHLQPGSLAKSTFRIVVTQSSFVLSTYANEQLQQDLARDKLVAAGEMTQEEADEAAEEWETREWKIRWESFPSKLTEALLKYHVIVLVMRLYENIVAKAVDNFTMDALTLDTFRYAKRLESKEGDNKMEIGRQMFNVCGYANLIAFLADYSVHQAILGYGYYRFVQEKKRKRQQRQLRQTSSDYDDEDDDDKKEDDKAKIGKHSAKLVVSRGLGLVFTATGGAVGSMILPGWGTLLGSNLGDSLGGVVSDVVPI